MPAQFCIFLRAENVRILESLDLPCFSCKGKAKQMDTLKKFLSNAEVVNIKYPEKVFTISFISQYGRPFVSIFAKYNSLLLNLIRYR